jgi:phage terminase small subunit
LTWLRAEILPRKKVGRLGINPKQEKFICEYLVDLNATQAAIRAGYSAKTAQEQGAQLLSKLIIKTEIDRRFAEIQSAKIAEAREIMEYLTGVLRGESESEESTAVGIVAKHPAEKDRLKAAELLGKRYSLFTENVKLSGDVGVSIIDDIPAE